MLTCWGHLHLQYLEWWRHPAPPGTLPAPDGFELWEIFHPPVFPTLSFTVTQCGPSAVCARPDEMGAGDDMGPILWLGSALLSAKGWKDCVEQKKQILWQIQYKICFIILTVAFSTIGLKTPSSWGVAETRWTFGKRSLKIDCVPYKVKLKGACYKAFYKIIALFGWKTLYLAITGSK